MVMRNKENFVIQILAHTKELYYQQSLTYLYVCLLEIVVHKFNHQIHWSGVCHEES